MSSIRFGMAQWQHSAWVDWLYPRAVPTGERLGHYAQYFDTVEVGSTFYTDVAPEQVQRWAEQVPDTFRFSFKAPQTVTHQLMQRPFADVLASWQQFQQRLSPVLNQLGATMLQFPKAIGSEYLPHIQQLCEAWQLEAPLSVEVRHLDFFDRANQEKTFLRSLAALQCNRVVMDSRPVFSTEAYSESLRDAQDKKPRVPCHPIATAQHPIVRYIGHPDLPRNHVWLDQWALKLVEWLREGRSPLVFVHSSDNVAAPTLASWLELKIQHHMPDYQLQLVLPAVHEQMGLI